MEDSEEEDSEVDDTDGEIQHVEDGAGELNPEREELISQHEERTRIRRQPCWMRDYKTGEGLSEEEQEENLAFYVSHDDPKNFDEAVKERKWQEVMEQEIQSIERNQTWELVSLPDGAKKIGSSSSARMECLPIRR